MRVELLEPQEGDRTWQVRVTRDGDEHPSLPLRTAIELSTSTKRVVELLHRMYKAAAILAPCGTTIYPRATSKNLELHKSQLSEPRR